MGSLLAVGPLLTACGGGDSASGAQACDSLSILTWETYHDPAWLQEFESESGIGVEAVTAGSAGEMLAKVRSTPDQFDLVVVTSGVYQDYVVSDLLVPIEEDRVEDIDETIRLGFDWRDAATVDGELYGVLYNWGNQPLAVAPEVAQDPAAAQYLDGEGEIDDWNILWDPAFAGRVSVFDDPISVLPMIALAAGLEDPYDLSESEFAEMDQKLMELRPQVSRLTSGFNDQTQQFATREAELGYLNNIASVSALADQNVELIVNNTPSAGMPAWTDSYGITQSGSECLDASYDFINHTLSMPWQARFVQASRNNGVLDYEQATSQEAVDAGLTPEAVDATLIPATQEGDDFFSRMLFFQQPADLQARLDLWNEFKLGIG